MLEIIEHVVKTFFKYVARVLRFTACSSKCHGSECTCRNDASLKMMYRHAFVAIKGRAGRRYWYCMCEEMYDVVRYEKIQTGYNVIRFDDYGEDNESPLGYVSCVDPNVVPPPWAVNLDDVITPYLFF